MHIAYIVFERNEVHFTVILNVLYDLCAPRAYDWWPNDLVFSWLCSRHNMTKCRLACDWGLSVQIKLRLPVPNLPDQVIYVGCLFVF